MFYSLNKWTLLWVYFKSDVSQLCLVKYCITLLHFNKEFKKTNCNFNILLCDSLLNVLSRVFRVSFLLVSFLQCLLFSFSCVSLHFSQFTCSISLLFTFFTYFLVSTCCLDPYFSVAINLRGPSFFHRCFFHVLASSFHALLHLISFPVPNVCLLSSLEDFLFSWFPTLP